MDQGKVTDILLVKYLLGEVSDTERSHVQQWLKESGDNKKRFYELKLVWDQSHKALVKSTMNAEEAWGRLKVRLAEKREQPRTIPLRTGGYKWLWAAAILLLLAGGTALVWYMAIPGEHPQIAQASISYDTPKVKNTNTIEELPKQNIEVKEVAAAKPYVPKIMKHDKVILVKRDARLDVAPPDMHSYGSKKYICNGTPCPLEVCITQSLTCGSRKPVSYSTCNTLEPDEAGQLSLKISGTPTKNCSQAIQEIRITHLTTGESIVLDANSSPATARDLYNYITGQKKGNILAGVFHTDCDNEESDQTLRFDNNNYGHLILQ